MSNGGLTVWIDGREALPVRAIPYVTLWQRYTPDALARLFARSHPMSTNSRLTAYHFSGNSVVQVKPREWDRVVMNLDLLESELNSRVPKWKKGIAEWYDRAAEELPAGVFVWLDEFQKEFQDEREAVIFCEERSGDNELTLSPVLGPDKRAMVMEGLEDINKKEPTGPAFVHVGGEVYRQLHSHELGYSASNTSAAAEPPAHPAIEPTREIQAGAVQMVKGRDDALLAHDPILDTAARAPIIRESYEKTDNVPTATPVPTAEAVPHHGLQKDFDEKLAALFDPVRVAQLEAMFPADRKWKNWVEKSQHNGLAAARTGERGLFNPYKAGVWFLSRGIPGWTTGRVMRVLAGSLPARSLDEKHLLTGELY